MRMVFPTGRILIAVIIGAGNLDCQPETVFGFDQQVSVTTGRLETDFASSVNDVSFSNEWRSTMEAENSSLLEN